MPQAFSPFRMSYAVQLKGLKLPPPSINLRLQPYALYQYDKSTNAIKETTTKSTIKAGADFSNVKPFFSRTIGLANAQFNADPVPIDAGIRYTERNQKRTLAGLYVHQRGTSHQGGVNFGVLRYLKNYGKQNNIGIMLTHRLDEEDNSKGFRQRNNTTISIDGFIRPKDDIMIQYIASAARDNNNDSIGLAGSFYIGWFPNKGYLYYWTDFVTEKYFPGMGYVFANNTIKSSTGGYFIWRPRKGWWAERIRRQDPGVFIDVYQNANDLKTQEVRLYIFPVYVFTKTNAQMEYATYLYWQNFTFSFPILGRIVSTGRYNYVRHLLRYQSDASKKISGKVRYEFGGYYNGRLSTTTLGCRFAPIPNIAVTFDYEYNNFKNFGTSNENFQAELYTAGLRLAANSRIQLAGFYQYNSFDKQGRWNFRGSWEFAPLSFLYLVFNDNNFKDSPVRNQSVISKISYLKQF